MKGYTFSTILNGCLNEEHVHGFSRAQTTRDCRAFTGREEDYTLRRPCACFLPALKRTKEHPPVRQSIKWTKLIAVRDFRPVRRNYAPAPREVRGTRGRTRACVGTPSAAGPSINFENGVSERSGSAKSASARGRHCRRLECRTLRFGRAVRYAGLKEDCVGGNSGQMIWNEV